MKTPSNELHRLIKSLTVQEKVYFKMYAQRKSKNKSKYLLLFDAVNKLKKYDEKEIKKLLKDNKNVLQNLKRVKSYTTKSILLSLAEYHANTSVESQIRNLLQQAEILISKKIFSLAEKTLKKIDALTTEYELFEYALLASKLRAEIAYTSEDSGKIETYLHEIKTDRILITKITNNIDFSALRFKAHPKILRQYLSDYSTSNKIKSITSSPLLSSPKNAITFFSTYNYYLIHYITAIAIGKHNKKDYERQKEWVSYLENNRIKKYPSTDVYLTSLASLIAIASYSTSENEAKIILSKAISYFHSLSPKLKTTSTLTALATVLNNYMHNQIVHLRPENAIKAYNDFINSNNLLIENYVIPDLKRVIYFNLGQCYLMLGNYKHALSYINKIIEYKQADLRFDIQIAARISFLILHYELGNLDILPYLCDSTTRWLAKRDITNKYYDKIIFFFRKTIYSFNTPKEMIVSFRNYRNEVLLLLKKDKMSINKNNIEYFLPWLTSKIENKTTIVVLKENKTDALV